MILSASEAAGTLALKADETGLLLPVESDEVCRLIVRAIINDQCFPVGIALGMKLSNVSVRVFSVFLAGRTYGRLEMITGARVLSACSKNSR